MPRINYTTKELYAGTIVKAVSTIITDITLYTLSAAEFVSQCFHQQGLNGRNVDVKRYDNVKDIRWPNWTCQYPWNLVVLTIVDV